MTTEGFDYKSFSNELANQAGELLPAEFEQFQKDYVVNTIRNFSVLCGEAVCNDQKYNFTVDQAMLITQIIAEWAFHKSIDLIKAGILPDYWDGIMQKIAFTIFEVSKQSLLRNVPQDELLQIVEHHVKKAYKTAIEELKERNILDEGVANQALCQSNIDEMMQKMQEDKAVQEQSHAPMSSGENTKILKLASVALLLKQMPQDKIQSILNKFNEDDAQTVIKYMQMNDLDSKVDQNITIRCLQEIKTNLPQPKFVNPNKILAMMNTVFTKASKEKIDQVVVNERPSVKDFIDRASQGEYSQISSKVANIIVQHLEENVS